eukprot:11312759-Alexandrium_andersonii.AAC.1
MFTRAHAYAHARPRAGVRARRRRAGQRQRVPGAARANWGADAGHFAQAQCTRERNNSPGVGRQGPNRRAGL